MVAIARPAHIKTINILKCETQIRSSPPNYQSNNFKAWNANFWYNSHGLLEERKCPSMVIHSGADGTRSVDDSEPAYNAVDSFPCRGFQHPEVRDRFIRQKKHRKGLYLLCLCLLTCMLYFETELAINSLTHSQA